VGYDAYIGLINILKTLLVLSMRTMMMMIMVMILSSP